MVAVAWTGGPFVVETVAVFAYVPADVVVVGLEMCTLIDAPPARLPKLQVSTWVPTGPVMAHVPGPV
jgi:hypothetical protein